MYKRKRVIVKNQEEMRKYMSEEFEDFKKKADPKNGE